MTWTSALRYARAHLDHAPTTADAAVPLRARIGGLVTYQQTPLIKASIAGSILDLPDTAGPDVIKAIGHVRLDMSGSLWRLETVFGDVLNDDNRFVQVYVNAQGDLVEALLCSRLSSFVPAPDEIPLFQGKAGQGLGERTYVLWRDQLLGIGVSEPELQAAMGGADRLEYTRDADPNDPFMAPFKGTETRIEDAAGTQGSQAQVWFMPYVRNLADGSPEYLLIQLSIDESQVGDTDRQGVFVQMWIGIPIEKERLLIQ